MAKAAKSSKTTTKATKAAKKTAAASGKGKENVASKSKKQNARSNAGKGGTKKKSGGGSAGGEGDKKKSGGITKAASNLLDAWWEQHSVALVKKAVEECDCIEAEARDIVKAYRQFLIVKREMKDWENELYPCYRVAVMMELHELHEDFDFQSDIEFLCGHDFGGNQLVVFDRGDDFDREKATFDAVKTRFGSECDDKLWNTLPICIVEVDGGMKWDPAKWVSANDDSCFITHRQKEECLESVFEEYTEDGDPEPLSNFQFLLSRTKEVIDPNDTALGLRLTHSDSNVIFALYTYETLIEVKVKKKDSSGPRLFYAADQKKPFSKALKDLVKDGEEDEKDYVFMFKGKRLYGFETPMSLQMKHFDIIDAIPSQDYKYQRCICCNIAEGNVLSSQCTGIC